MRVLKIIKAGRYTYGVGEFCEAYGYAYIKKREFVDPIKGSRYAGYGHVKTSDSTAVATAEKGREFIFEKKIPGKVYGGSSQKKLTSKGASRSVLKSMGTDSDSSSYVEHSDYEGKDMSSFGKIPDSAVKAKAPSVAATLTLGGIGGTVSIRDKTKVSKEEALAVTDSSFKRK